MVGSVHFPKSRPSLPEGRGLVNGVSSRKRSWAASVGLNEASVVMSAHTCLHLLLSGEYSTTLSVRSNSKGNGSISAGSKIYGSASNIARNWRSRYDGSGGKKEGKCELHIERYLLR